MFNTMRCSYHVKICLAIWAASTTVWWGTWCTLGSVTGTELQDGNKMYNTMNVVYTGNTIGLLKYAKGDSL